MRELDLEQPAAVTSQPPVQKMKELDLKDPVLQSAKELDLEEESQFFQNRTTGEEEFQALRSIGTAFRTAAIDTVNMAGLSLLNQFGQRMSSPESQLISSKFPTVRSPFADLRDELGIIEYGKNLQATTSQARRDLAKEIAERVQANKVDSFWTWDLPTFVGEVGGTTALSAVNPTLGLAYGAAQAGGGGALDALASRKPLTDDEINLSAGLNAAFGTTSGVVSFRMLQRLGITGKVAQTFTKKLIEHRTAGKFLGDLSKSAMENALQEVLEEIGGNWVASDVVGYDPARPLTEGLIDAAKGGASAGAIVDLLLTALKRGNQKAFRDKYGRTKWQQRQAEKYEKAVEAAAKGADVAVVQGTYTPVGTQIETRKELSDKLAQPDDPLVHLEDELTNRYVWITGRGATSTDSSITLLEDGSSHVPAQIKVRIENGKAVVSVDDLVASPVETAFPTVKEAVEFAEAESDRLKFPTLNAVYKTELLEWKDRLGKRVLVAKAAERVEVQGELTSLGIVDPVTQEPLFSFEEITYDRKLGISRSNNYPPDVFPAANLTEAEEKAKILFLERANSSGLTSTRAIKQLIDHPRGESLLETSSSRFRGRVSPRQLHNEVLSGFSSKILTALGVAHSATPLPGGGELITFANKEQPPTFNPGNILAVQDRTGFSDFILNKKAELATAQQELNDMKIRHGRRKGPLTIRMKSEVQTKEAEVARTKNELIRALKAQRNFNRLIKFATTIGKFSNRLMGKNYKSVVTFAQGLHSSFHLGALANELSSVQIGLDLNKMHEREHVLEVAEAIIHEFGHGVFDSVINRHLDLLKRDRPAEYVELFEKLNSAYLRWAQTKIRQPVSSMLVDLPGAASMIAKEQSISSSTILGDQHNLSYYASAAEFMAEFFASGIVEGNIQFDETLTKFGQDMLTDMKAMFHGIRALSSEPSFFDSVNSFTKYMDLLTFEGRNKLWMAKKADKEVTKYQTLRNMILNNNDEDAFWDAESLDAFLEAKVRFNWWIKNTFGLLNLRDINPDIPEIGDYVAGMSAWHARRVSLVRRGDTITRQIKDLPRAQRQKLSHWIFDEDFQGVFFDAAELQTRGITAETLEVYKSIKQVFLDSLMEAKNSSEALLREAFAATPLELHTKLAELEQDFNAMLAKPYFPHLRYGNWTTGVYNDEGKIVAFTARETKWGQKQAAKEYRAHFGPRAKVFTSKFTDQFRDLQGMPAFYLQALKKQLPTLSPEQEQVLNFLIEENSPVKGYKQRFLPRKGVEGYSEDLMRGFNSFVLSHASHTARTEFVPVIRQAITDLATRAEILREAGKDANKVSDLINYLHEHFEYMTTPQVEWHALRSFIFTWSLGFNTKSAAMNFASIPMVTYPYLAARFGDRPAQAALSWATTELYKIVHNPQKADPRMIKLLEWGTEQGFIDQSLMMEAAVAASEYSENQNPFLPAWKRGAYQISFAGAVPFQLVEKLNRNITAIAAAKLAFDSSASRDEPDGQQSVAFDFAKQAVSATQNENARWNNPRFARGRTGALFPFMKYVANTVNRFAFGNDPAAFRFWLGVLTLAGLSGLPFIEDLEDILDALLTQYKQRMGMKDPHTELSADMHRLIGALGADPELVMHGITSESFGLGFVADNLGFPFPKIDVSNSIGFGNILPFTKTIKKLGQNKDMTGSEIVGSLLEESGASGSSIVSLIGALAADNPDTWARAEVGLPAAFRNASRTIRAAAREGVFSRAGDQIAAFETHDPVAKAELAAMALGFQPSRVTQGWEKEAWKLQGASYYSTWRNQLLERRNFAYYTKDREAIARVEKDIKVFRKQVPFPELGLEAASLQESLKKYIENKEKARLGLPRNIREYRLNQSYEGLQGEAR